MRDSIRRKPVCHFVNFLCVVFCFGIANKSVAQDGGSQQALPALKPSDVVATVDNESVLWADVQFQLRSALGERVSQLKGDAANVATAAAVRQLVEQLLVSEYLKKTSFKIGDDTLKLSLERLEQQLARTETTLDQMLVQRGETMNHLKQQMRWQGGWGKYIKEYLTDENLGTYFNEHKKDFDGTQYHVAHILLAPSEEQKSSGKSMAEIGEQLMTQAKQVRQDLINKSTNWDESVASHSAAASTNPNGDLGWIERRKPMPEGFSKVAFELKQGEISQPISSNFGIHLIKCIEIKPGEKKLGEVRKEVKAAATQYLFQWVVKQQKGESRIWYSDRIPHFDVKTGKLVEAK